MSEALRAVEARLRAACGDRVRTAFPMASLTTFRIGGPAALYLEPDSIGDLDAVAAAMVDADVPLVVLGKGSNVLVADEGFPGLVLRLGRGFRWAARNEDRVTSGGAMPLPALAGVAQRHALAGLEFGVAIPATLGGAVRMNAGAHGRSMSDVIEVVDVYRVSNGTMQRVSSEDIGFAYRRTDLPDDAIVVSVIVRLEPGDDASIRAGMEEAREWRRRTQPLAEPNCGSVFKNPEGDHAARLIEAAGCKGMRVGGASVSTKHANFIVADPGATATDVVALIEQIRGAVEARSGVDLETEVHVLGRSQDAA